jgi:transcriptional regulator GlxA family with amidase domain/cytochrome c
MHRVVVVATDGVIPFDLSTPCGVFESVRVCGDRRGYRVRVCGVTREVDAGTFRMKLRHGLDELARADTIILPGTGDVGAEVPLPLVRALRKAAARGARIASVCSGAFLLAATGLLDGRRATTHWLAAAELARRYPMIRVDPDVLYVDEGQVLTSAGAAAAFDLCLHLVRRDYGSAVAAEAARVAVMPLERDGGQSQFIVHAPPTADGSSLAPLLHWLEANCRNELTLDDIARRAAMSVRSLNRQFRAQTGTTPLQWLIRARVRRAQQLLETTAQSVERIASHVGFGSVTALRGHFRRLVATSPKAYRHAFRSQPAGRKHRASLHTVLCLIGIAVFFAGAARAAPSPVQHKLAAPIPEPAPFPPGPLADAVRLGENIVSRTTTYARAYTKAELNCTSCHLVGGRTPGASPWVGIWGVFPAYSARSATVETLADRINDCFERSMNGKALPLGSAEMTAVLAYMRWLSQGVPTGEDGPSRGFAKIAASRKPDAVRGKSLFLERCAACHGPDGEGATAKDGEPEFPPLWGPRSFNIAAGMARLDTAAAFIYANMPAEQPGTLDVDDAFDIAAFVTAQPRPAFAAKRED